ncbi:MAG: hypothetical protein K8I27_09110 [Planctomycetes bacterium]|nr:hypothetical protein [Planctomycetota bacterium]
MVHIPNDDDKQTGQHRQAPDRAPTGPAKRPAQRPPSGQQQRVPTDQQQRVPTDQQRRVPTGQQQRVPTGQQQRPPEKKTGPVAGPRPKQRSTQMLSLEPPKRKRGPSLGQMNTRLDGMGGPTTRSQRNRQLFGGIGREKTGQTDVMNPQQGGDSAAGNRPTLRKPGKGNTGPVDLGASAAEVDGMIVRRKGTRRIPKQGGGIEGEAAPLDSMGSGRRPAVDPGPQARDIPPVVNIPVPRQPVRRPDSPTPPASRGNTLAGVSAEDLLGEEGRAVLEKMRQREAQTRQQPQQAPPPRPQYAPPGQPIAPRAQDSSRMAFQSAEYAAGETLEEVRSDDELRPQDSFLSGPTRQIQRNVVQTPMPVDEVYEADPPPDDLGYERAVDFGDARQTENDEEPVARESAAHDEMEQRAGYLLWLQGVITREEVEDSLMDEEIDDAMRDLLAETSFTDQITLYRFLARHESLAPVDLEQVRPTERALATLRPAIARAYRVIPIEKIGELLLVAAAFPFDPKRLLELRRLTASKVKLYVVTEEEVDLALMKYYPGGASSAATLRSPKPPGIGDADHEVDEPANAADESSITGEGEALEYNYDPTLSGEDSGLYAPMDDPDDSRYPSGDVGISEIEDAGDTVQDDVDDVEGGNDYSDLDESTLDQNPGDESPEDGTDGSFSSAPTDPEGERPDELRAAGGDIDTGPEELDPFA